MIAYLIMCHKNPLQVSRLIKSLYHEDNLYFIHVDAKSEDFDISLLPNYQNVIILPRQRVFWATWSIVDVELNAMLYALKYEGWEYFINLSGQCYPLKTQKQIFEFLRKTDRDYLHFFVGKEQQIKKNISVNDSNFEDLFPDQMLMLGSQWMILKRRTCLEVLSNERFYDYTSYFVRTNIPDEMFFQTLLFNSEYEMPLDQQYCRYIHFLNDGDDHPRTLVAQDFPNLIMTTDLFARKFDISVDSSILDMLDFNLDTLSKKGF